MSADTKRYEVSDTRDGGMPFVNIVFTCGGTGGHIYPAIAVARLFEQRQPGCNILFIGAEDGMEIFFCRSQALARRKICFWPAHWEVEPSRFTAQRESRKSPT